MKRASIGAALLGVAATFGAGAGCAEAPGAADAARRVAEIPAGFLGEADLPAGLLAGLPDSAKRHALLAVNREACGCIEACQAVEAGCAPGLVLLRQAAELARAGGTAEEIGAALRRIPTAASAPAPVERMRRGHLVDAHDDHVHGVGEMPHAAPVAPDDGKKGSRQFVR